MLSFVRSSVHPSGHRWQRGSSAQVASRRTIPVFILQRHLSSAPGTVDRDGLYDTTAAPFRRALKYWRKAGLAYRIYSVQFVGVILLTSPYRRTRDSSALWCKSLIYIDKNIDLTDSRDDISPPLCSKSPASVYFCSWVRPRIFGPCFRHSWSYFWPDRFDF